MILALIMFFLWPSGCEEDLIGRWKLISWEATTDSNTMEPYGPDAFGFLEYNPDSTMILMLMKRGRTSEDVQNQKGFFTYMATYEVDCEEGKVAHSVRACSHPDWVGQTQYREFQLSNDTLVIRSPRLKTTSTENKEAVHQLIWLRTN